MNIHDESFTCTYFNCTLLSKESLFFLFRYNLGWIFHLNLYIHRDSSIIYWDADDVMINTFFHIDYTQISKRISSMSRKTTVNFPPSVFPPFLIFFVMKIVPAHSATTSYSTSLLIPRFLCLITEHIVAWVHPPGALNFLQFSIFPCSASTWQNMERYRKA